MFLSRSRSLKIKKKLFDKMKHASRTSYNNLASRSGPYWSLNFTDCAMKNTPSFSNTSAKMNFASSDCSATISMSSSLSCIYFLRCRSKKDDIQRGTVNHFVELLTDINEMGIIHTNLSASSDFPPAVIGTSPPFRQPWMGPASHRYDFFGHWATLKGETLESGMCD